MVSSREFEIGVVVSATTGRLVAKNGITDLYEFFEFLTGSPVLTHQLPRIAEESREGLVEQFPWLGDIIVPEDLDKHNYKEWVNALAAEHGETLLVECLIDQVGKIDPLEELANMICQKKVIVVVIDD